MNAEPKANIVMQKTDPSRVSWCNSNSPYGYNLAEVISAMGKEIRRGQDELSVFWAYQMMISGSQSEDFLWERFKVISIEDVGMANPNALVVVNNAEKLYYEQAHPTRLFDRHAVGAYTAVYLARSPKTRYTHELMEDVIERLKDGTLRPEIPDYALDFHQPRVRRELGRDKLSYLTCGALLANENKKFPTEYRDRLIQRARDTRVKKNTERLLALIKNS